ncbi:hypothetical protein EV424DRAFT_6311 [Suillus variegatus]|nr:hypothetical protein EV424DRAFT_6311 [Suillus variegatus]
MVADTLADLMSKVHVGSTAVNIPRPYHYTCHFSRYCCTVVRNPAWCYDIFFYSRHCSHRQGNQNHQSVSPCVNSNKTLRTFFHLCISSIFFISLRLNLRCVHPRCDSKDISSFASRGAIMCRNRGMDIIKSGAVGGFNGPTHAMGDPPMASLLSRLLGCRYICSSSSRGIVPSASSRASTRSEISHSSRQQSHDVTQGTQRHR